MLLLEDKIEKIIEAISEIIPADFGCDTEEDDLWNFSIDDAFYILSEIDPYINIEYGVSKLVIIPSFGNQVIKIPFNGKWYIEYPYNEETEETDWDAEPDAFFEEFRSADSEDGDDYCEAETRIFEEAIDASIDPLFAGTTFYKTVNGIKFYLQEKIPTIGIRKTHIKSSSDSYSLAKSISGSKGGIRCIEWLAAVIEYYGEAVAKLLMNFIYDEEIGDLHSGNVGFRANGEPVLVDYSSWHE